jgi:magnesium chelatase subunit I
VSIDDLDEVTVAFEDGLVVETGDRVPSREYVHWMREILDSATLSPDRRPQRSIARGRAALVACAVEFLLEGLHLQRRVTGPTRAGTTYRR